MRMIRCADRMQHTARSGCGIFSPSTAENGCPRVISPFPFNPIPRTTAGEKKLPSGRAIRAYRYDEHHVVETACHKVTADRLFVDSEGSMKLSAAAARPPVDGAAPKDAHREVRQLIDVYPDVTTRIRANQGVAWRGIATLNRSNRGNRPWPLSTRIMAYRSPFRLKRSSHSPQSRCDQYCREVWTSPWWVTRIGFPNAPPCRRVIAYRAAGIRWLRLSTLRLKQSLHFPTHDFFFFFILGTISKLTRPAKKAPLPNHNCHEQAITAI